MKWKNNIINYKIESTHFAPDAANISAHSLGSRREWFFPKPNRKIMISDYRKILHEIEQQNLHMSNQGDKLHSWKQLVWHLDGFLSSSTTSYTCRMHRTYVLFLKITHHSEVIDGTLKTPQWMKMPILLWSYHAGNGRESMDVQFAMYCCSVNGKSEEQITARNTAVAKEFMLLIYKSQQ